MDWSPASWRNFEARQQPDYADLEALGAIESELTRRPPLVGLAAIDRLAGELARAQEGAAFLVQGGDCAEGFDDNQRPTVRLLEAMASAIARESGIAAVAVGRLAGQYAKPRSEPFEKRGTTALPAWRGDLINRRDFEPAARHPDPARMLEGYERAAAALAQLEGGAVFVSHEALLLPWEQALVRSENGRRYASSGHFLWIGERTLFEGSAHVEFTRGIANPLGLKCGPGLAPEALLRLLDTLDPGRLAGRVTLIARMGAERIERALPPLIRAVAREGHPVLWACDPMHGNTRRAVGGRKIRLLGEIERELRAFLALAAAEGVRAGGLHVEMTGEAIAECGPAGAPDAACDPRLNREQALRLAALVAEDLAARTPPRGLGDAHRLDAPVGAV